MFLVFKNGITSFQVYDPSHASLRNYWSSLHCSAELCDSCQSYHIWVIEVPGSSHLHKMRFIIAIEIYDTGHTVPGVLNVPIISPNVTVLSYLWVVGLGMGLTKLASKHDTASKMLALPLHHLLPWVLANMVTSSAGSTMITSSEVTRLRVLEMLLPCPPILGLPFLRVTGYQFLELLQYQFQGSGDLYTTMTNPTGYLSNTVGGLPCLLSKLTPLHRLDPRSR